MRVSRFGLDAKFEAEVPLQVNDELTSPPLWPQKQFVIPNFELKEVNLVLFGIRRPELTHSPVVFTRYEAVGTHVRLEDCSPVNENRVYPNFGVSWSGKWVYIDGLVISMVIKKGD